jgi:hypothetical protein
MFAIATETVSFQQTVQPLSHLNAGLMNIMSSVQPCVASQHVIVKKPYSVDWDVKKDATAMKVMFAIATTCASRRKNVQFNQFVRLSNITRNVEDLNHVCRLVTSQLENLFVRPCASLAVSVMKVMSKTRMETASNLMTALLQASAQLTKSTVNAVPTAAKCSVIGTSILPVTHADLFALLAVFVKKDTFAMMRELVFILINAQSFLNAPKIKNALVVRQTVMEQQCVIAFFVEV